MIADKKELRFYCMADSMMNRGCFRLPLAHRLARIFYPDHVMDYLRHMRYFSYYSAHRKTISGKLRYFWHKARYYKLGLKLGYSIGCDCFGYGLRLPHYGSIVVGKSNRIGPYAMLFPASCIVDEASEIGEAFFLAHGAVLSKQVRLGHQVVVAANSVMNVSCEEGCAIFAGSPAKKVKDNPKPWYAGVWGKDPIWLQRVEQVEELRQKMFSRN